MDLELWKIASLDKDSAAQLAERYSIPFFLAMLLEIRGWSREEQVTELLGGETSLSDPFLMKDMEKAAGRIRRAIDGFEKIAVYGDYDADGVTATAMVFTYLEALGADVMYYIPQREGEGYGMNRHAVEYLHSQGVKLIVTVDNGISSVEEVALANSLGMDVVVTDHHRPQERLPEAVAVVDAYQQGEESPYRDFSGAGVALKLLIALEEGDSHGILEEYADLAALGRYNFTKAFLGVNGVTISQGFTTPDPEEAAVKSLAADRAQSVYVLADSSKFGQVTAAVMFPIEAACVITDRLPDRRYRDYTDIREV